MLISRRTQSLQISPPLEEGLSQKVIWEGDAYACGRLCSAVPYSTVQGVDCRRCALSTVARFDSRLGLCGRVSTQPVMDML